MAGSAYTTARGTNPVMDAVLYWRISAWLLTAVAAIGFILDAAGMGAALGEDLLAFDLTHNVLHGVLAAAAFILGYGAIQVRTVKRSAVVFGIAYLGFGLLGLSVARIGTLGLEVGETLLHIVLGTWALVAGLTDRS